VSLIERTAQRILDHDDAETKIHGVEHGSQHANIGFGTGDNESVDVLIVEKRCKTRFRERGIGGLVDDVAGGTRRDSGGTISSCEGDKRERVAHSHLVKYRCQRPGLSPGCNGVTNRVNTVRGGFSSAIVTIAGRTFSIQGVPQIPPGANRFCMSRIGGLHLKSARTTAAVPYLRFPYLNVPLLQALQNLVVDPRKNAFFGCPFQDNKPEVRLQNSAPWHAAMSIYRGVQNVLSRSYPPDRTHLRLLRHPKRRRRPSDRFSVRRLSIKARIARAPARPSERKIRSTLASRGLFSTT